MPITHYLPRNPSTATVSGPQATASSHATSPGAATLEPANSYTPPRDRKGSSLPSPFTTPKPSTPNKPAAKRKEPPTSPVPDSKRPAAKAPKKSSANTSSNFVDTAQLRNDRLGTLVRNLCKRFTEALSWEEFVQEFRGLSYLARDLDDIDHPAAELLRHWRDNGVPAETTSPAWTPEQIGRASCRER